jgi:hypothetical protein
MKTHKLSAGQPANGEASLSTDVLYFLWRTSFKSEKQFSFRDIFEILKHNHFHIAQGWICLQD